jgi:hypothetical protein
MLMLLCAQVAMVAVLSSRDYREREGFEIGAFNSRRSSHSFHLVLSVPSSRSRIVHYIPSNSSSAYHRLPKLAPVCSNRQSATQQGPFLLIA